MPKNQKAGGLSHLPFGPLSVDKAKAEAERQKRMKKFVVSTTKEKR